MPLEKIPVPLHPEIRSQVDVPYMPVTEHRLGRSRGNDPALVQDAGMVTDAQCLPDIMVGDQYADTTVAQVADDLLYVQDRDRVNTGKGLIQK